MKPCFLQSALAVGVSVLVGCGGDSDSSTAVVDPPVVEAPVVEAPTPVEATTINILPYVQNPTTSSISVTWFGSAAESATVEVDGIGSFQSEIQMTDALTYGTSEIDYIHGESNFGATHADVADGQAPQAVYKHYVKIDGLESGTSYDYTVLQPGADEFTANFKTSPSKESREAIRFVTMSDMETEPESTEKTVRWTANALALGGEKLGTDPDTYTRQYPVDQTTGYKANLTYAELRSPDFWVIAGDLVEKGGRQLDWDEFWRHSAGEWGTLASSTPIFPALGNHENYWHPEYPGYNAEASMLSYDKWNTYWDLPTNHASDDRYQKRYYRVDYGPVTLITLDSSNGNDADPSQDTNLYIDGAASRVPDFNRGTEQWNWALSELADAQAQGQVIFVQYHHSAFGTGVHSLPSGSAGIANGEDSQSGMPMRIYHELFERYGVTAVLSGHDELLEYVNIDGVSYWDVGFAGDGLRGPGYPPTTDYVPFDLLPADAQASHWSAHGDAPEVWDGNKLVSGGKHYGFLEVEVRPAGDYNYEVVMTPRFVFPVMDDAGMATGEFDHRQYNKVVRVLVER
ncbi:metallophosphoesterase family protein [Gilvimarinus polysaccharolyticus]|uniref:metallophosphoesterase family protein n=1 Tax=Gilvimarinus polysaccharolyticus TaxID=863921 RepID=UPI000673A8B9|nr:metallophosphoesterase [Gilvimarinus polysaccharolyticus]